MNLRIGITLVVLALAAAVLGPWLVPADPRSQDLALRLAGPTLAHPFGLDELGRDILARLVAGARISLIVGFGPEQGHELLASHALPAGGGERGQQRQALGLRRGAFEAGSVTLKGEASENGEPEHE